jgi:hypothetical protein
MGQFGSKGGLRRFVPVKKASVRAIAGPPTQRRLPKAPASGARKSTKSP